MSDIYYEHSLRVTRENTFSGIGLWSFMLGQGIPCLFGFHDGFLQIISGVFFAVIGITVGIVGNWRKRRCKKIKQ